MKKTLALALLTTALSAPAFAEGYIDVLAGGSSTKTSQPVLMSDNDFLFSSYTTTVSAKTSNFAAGFNVGGFVNEYFGAEAGYKNFGANDFYSGQFVGRIKPTADIQLLAKVGSGYLMNNYNKDITNASTSGWAWSAGLGAKYAIAKQIDLTVDYTHIGSVGYVQSADVYMGGISYRF